MTGPNRAGAYAMGGGEKPKKPPTGPPAGVPVGEKKERRPQHERRAIRQIMVEKDIKYTAALREYEARKKKD